MIYFFVAAPRVDLSRLQVHRIILCVLVGVVRQQALVGLEARSEDEASGLILGDLVGVECQVLVVR